MAGFSQRWAIRVSGDRMAAFVTVRAGTPGAADGLRAALGAAGVRAGLDDARIEQLGAGLASAEFAITSQEVAAGRAAQPGADGWFEPAFQAGLQPGHLREDGTLDLHDRELLKPALEGDVLGRFHPARPGVEGLLVDGSVLPVPRVREAALALGSGVARDAAGVVRAARSGVVLYKPEQSLDVVDHHVHQGPVALRSGNLHMQGSLVVQGDVERSFGVYASGDVEIRGGVDDGSVYAGGNLRVRGRVHGGQSGLVCAEGDAALRQAEAVSVSAGGTLSLVEGVHVTLHARRIQVSGRLHGGLACAEESLLVREAGASTRVDTKLQAGEPLARPLEGVQRALERHRSLRGAERSGGRAGASGTARAKGGKLERARMGFDREEIARRVERAARRRALVRLAVVELAIAHPGVTIQIADERLLLETETRRARFFISPETGKLTLEEKQK